MRNYIFIGHNNTQTSPDFPSEEWRLIKLKYDVQGARTSPFFAPKAIKDVFMMLHHNSQKDYHPKEQEIKENSCTEHKSISEYNQHRVIHSI